MLAGATASVPSLPARPRLRRLGERALLVFALGVLVAICLTLLMRQSLLPQLDASRFWQIHRGTVVRCDAIATATREESGRVTLTLRDHPDRLTVSRLYAHLFKAM